jgi:hypothetical protein
MYTSSKLLAWDRGIADQIIPVPIGSNQYTVHTSGGRGHTLRFVVGEDAFASWFYGVDGWSQFRVIDATGTERLFRAVPGRHVRNMASDGTFIFWSEEFGGATASDDPTRSEIFVAPYTNDATRLAATAKKLLALPYPMSGAFHASDGILRIFVDTDVSLLVRSDGATQTLESPGLGHADPGILRGGKYYTLTAEKNAFGEYPRGTGFARFTLGAWTPPS